MWEYREEWYLFFPEGSVRGDWVVTLQLIGYDFIKW